MKRNYKNFGKAFLVTGIPYGLLMGIFFAMQTSVVAGAISGLFCALFFGLLFNGTMVLINKKISKDKSLHWTELVGNVEQSKQYTTQKSIDEIHRALKEHFKSKKFKKYNFAISDNVFCAKTRITLQSWGEHITVKIDTISRNETSVQIQSKPVLKTTIYDGGNNRKNIKEIVEAIG